MIIFYIGFTLILLTIAVGWGLHPYFLPRIVAHLPCLTKCNAVVAFGFHSDFSFNIENGLGAK